MTRPSRNLDRLMIEAGKKLLPKHGVSGMSIQMVVDKAGVNLGMFSYHFKTKANFVRQVLMAISQEAAQGAQFKVAEGATSIEKLRQFLIFMTKTFRDQSDLVLSMFKDLLNQDPDISELILKNTNEQMEIMKAMILACQKDGFIDPKISVAQVEVFCNSALKGPIIMTEAVHRLQKGKKKDSLKIHMKPLTDAEIEQLVSMVLRGIEPKGDKK